MISASSHTPTLPFEDHAIPSDTGYPERMCISANSFQSYFILKVKDSLQNFNDVSRVEKSHIHQSGDILLRVLIRPESQQWKVCSYRDSRDMTQKLWISQSWESVLWFKSWKTSTSWKFLQRLQVIKSVLITERLRHGHGPCTEHPVNFSYHHLSTK